MATSPVSLDTNGLLALINRDDRLHESASEVFTKVVHSGAMLLLTDWVIAETGNGLARTSARQAFHSSVVTLLNDPRTNFIVVDSRRMKLALERYHQRSDKTWGLVDCSTMLAMEEFDSTEAFTSDQHFEQAGFTALLRSVG